LINKVTKALIIFIPELVDVTLWLCFLQQSLAHVLSFSVAMRNSLRISFFDDTGFFWNPEMLYHIPAIIFYIVLFPLI
jgi:hypothetical protein